MSIFGFGFFSLSATSILGGSISASFQVPGTFGGINPEDPTQGRFLKSALVWADAPVNGDKIALLQVADNDGVIPAPARAAFPNYPVIMDLIDAGSGILIPPTPLLIEVFDSNGMPATRFIPSQLYINLTYTTGGLTIGKVFRAVIRWGLWQ